MPKPEITSMKTLIAAAIRCSLMFLLPTVACAISAQWNLDPISGDWNTAANWTPATVPNGSADTATFDLSNTTNVSISANTEINGIIFTPAATNPYTITASPGLTLTISGVGITNNSGIAQTLFAQGLFDPFPGDPGEIVFTHRASAGNVNIVTFGGSVQFSNRSTAGSATIFNDSIGSVRFFDTSTADTAFIFCGLMCSENFFDQSTAASATLALGDEDFLSFFDQSSAGNATINGGFFFPNIISFLDSSTAGSATIDGRGSWIFFSDHSEGGTAAIGLSSGERFGFLSISDHSAPGVTIGSLEDTVFPDDFFPNVVSLGANNLTVGSNDLSTTFSGVIQDGGLNGNGVGGSLTKIGRGTLDLMGANTYTGVTNINGGVLQVDGSISSNTFVNHKGALAGAGTVYGNVTNYGGEVSPGDPLGVPGVLTVSNNYMQTPSASLVIEIAGTDPGEVGVLNVLGNANLNGALDPELVNGFVPEIGQSFTFMNYASFAGSFSHIRNPVFDHGRKRWLLTYNPTSAVLTVIRNGRSG
jgi:autotransporter-associated beta strand protein